MSHAWPSADVDSANALFTNGLSSCSNEISPPSPSTSALPIRMSCRPPRMSTSMFALEFDSDEWMESLIGKLIHRCPLHKWLVVLLQDSKEISPPSHLAELNRVFFSEPSKIVVVGMEQQNY